MQQNQQVVQHVEMEHIRQQRDQRAVQHVQQDIIVHEERRFNVHVEVTVRHDQVVQKRVDEENIVRRDQQHQVIVRI